MTDWASLKDVRAAVKTETGTKALDGIQPSTAEHLAVLEQLTDAELAKLATGSASAAALGWVATDAATHGALGTRLFDVLVTKTNAKHLTSSTARELFFAVSRAGDVARSRIATELLAHLIDRDGDTALAAACCFCVIGDHDRAVELVKIAKAKKAWGLKGLKSLAALKPIAKRL